MQVTRKRHPHLFVISLTVFLFLMTTPVFSEPLVYTVKSRINLRQGPGVNHPVMSTLGHNQTLAVNEKTNGWVKVTTPSGTSGFVRQDMVSDLWIKVHKKERRLYLMKGRDTVVKRFSIALSRENPLSDKKRLGDRATPEGRFFICDRIKHPDPNRYGARSMRISYPTVEDARRGLKDRIITLDQYRSIAAHISLRSMPDQTTALGGSIRIHGGGGQTDWTLGCIALDDDDIMALFPLVRTGYRVEIYRSAARDKALNSPGYLNRMILKGAENQLKKPALYTLEATKVIRLAYPWGDIPDDQAVCTDIVIRALRHAGIDLQALVNEDARNHPGAYAPDITHPDYHIDHRRVRTLKRFFDRHGLDLSTSPEKAGPGDIVIMDTGIQNGTLCDHIGIVSDKRDENGNYAVINIWTVGARTSTMSLIGRPYPEIAYYYRLTHPFDYSAVP